MSVGTSSFSPTLLCMKLFLCCPGVWMWTSDVLRGPRFDHRYLGARALCARSPSVSGSVTWNLKHPNPVRVKTSLTLTPTHSTPISCNVSPRIPRYTGCAPTSASPHTAAQEGSIFHEVYAAISNRPSELRELCKDISDESWPKIVDLLTDFGVEAELQR